MPWVQPTIVISAHYTIKQCGPHVRQAPRITRQHKSWHPADAMSPKLHCASLRGVYRMCVHTARPPLTTMTSVSHICVAIISPPTLNKRRARMTTSRHITNRQQYNLYNAYLCYRRVRRAQYNRRGAVVLPPVQLTPPIKCVPTCDSANERKSTYGSTMNRARIIARTEQRTDHWYMQARVVIATIPITQCTPNRLVGHGL